MGFMWGPRVSSSSVWVVVSGVSAFVALLRTSRRCHRPSKPPLVKKGGRRHGGGALKIWKIYFCNLLNIFRNLKEFAGPAARGVSDPVFELFYSISSIQKFCNGGRLWELF